MIITWLLYGRPADLTAATGPMINRLLKLLEIAAD
jgi:hypothetical protein